MTTFIYILRRCFCLCPWDAYSLWLSWKGANDEDFDDSVLDAVDAYAADRFSPWYEPSMMAIARPIVAFRYELARLWHPISRWKNNRKWKQWTRENL